ncbi:hypothetical protein ACLB1Q_14615 [Escherichia coli]
MIGEKIADMIRGQGALPRSTAGYFVANGMPVRAKKMKEKLAFELTQEPIRSRVTVPGMGTESLYKH